MTWTTRRRGAAPQRPPALVVASTTRQWVADDLTGAAQAAGLELVRSYALDVPDLSRFGQVTWWTPTEHAARLIHAGVDFAMASPGPHFLPTLSGHATGRQVWTGPVADLRSCPVLIGWMKPAEFKHDDLPARYYSSRADFADACAAAGLPADAVVQVAAPLAAMRWEFRFFIAHGKVVASSPYLAPDGTTWHEGMRADKDAQRLAKALAADVAATADAPGGYVLDVAQSSRGPVVLEANPVFSSAMYGADPAGVLRALIAATDPEPRWRYAPDPYLTARAARQRTLPGPVVA